MDFTSAEQLLEICAGERLTIAQAMRLREETLFETESEQIERRMETALQIMEEACHKPLKEPVNSIGGLIGGEAARVQGRQRAGKTICGTMTSKAITYALAVLEVNASMGRIVAAPTAGSSGVLPAAVLSLMEEFSLERGQAIDGLFTAGAIGYLIMHNASVSGAEAGCQAEVGSASAMAAAAAVSMMGGSPRQCETAASTALANLLGLVCDPVAGLVETPCQSRNVLGVTNAISCAEMALSGIGQLIPLDQMIGAMMSVGRAIPFELRETALGGCAATEAGCQTCGEIFGGPNTFER